MRHVLTEIIHCKPRFHVFVLLFENSVTIQINERKLKENQHVSDKKKAKRSLRNCSGQRARSWNVRIRQSPGFIQSRAALQNLLQTVSQYNPEISEVIPVCLYTEILVYLCVAKHCLQCNLKLSVC